MGTNENLKSLIKGTDFIDISSGNETFLVLKGFKKEKYSIEIKVNGKINVTIDKPDINITNLNLKSEYVLNIDDITLIQGELYKFNKSKFDELITLLKKHTKLASKHVRFDINEDSNLFKKKSTVKNFVDIFIKIPTEENFKKFWNGSLINAVQQRSNYENIKNKTGYNINELKEIIEKIIKSNGDTFDKKVIEIKKNDGMRNSALEFYYSYFINDENPENHFPNFNSTTNGGIKFIETLLGKDYFKDCDGIQKQQDKIIDDYQLDKFQEISEGKYLNKYYVVDQLFNLLTKTKPNDDSGNTISDVENLYIKTKELKSFFIEDIQSVKDVIVDLKIFNNVIYYGAPGTGKTFCVKEAIKYKLGGSLNSERFALVQFHPSYTYEDFIEGFKPVASVSGNIQFELKNGIFKEFCKKAFLRPKEQFYFVIDEINRAELSRVFGEILFCIEYRIKYKEGNWDLSEGLIKTPNSSYIEKLDEQRKKELSVCIDEKGNSWFGIPENITIIGTMNDIDRSIDSFDLALRRRFAWKRMSFEKDVLSQQGFSDDYIDDCEKLNKYLCNDLSLGSNYEIGHAYFLKIKDFINTKGTEIKIESKDQEKLFNYHLNPLIKEYLRSQIAEKDIDEKLEKCAEKFGIKKEKNNGQEVNTTK